MKGEKSRKLEGDGREEGGQWQDAEFSHNDNISIRKSLTPKGREDFHLEPVMMETHQCYYFLLFSFQTCSLLEVIGVVRKSWFSSCEKCCSQFTY